MKSKQLSWNWCIPLGLLNDAIMLIFRTYILIFLILYLHFSLCLFFRITVEISFKDVLLTLCSSPQLVSFRIRVIIFLIFDSFQFLQHTNLTITQSFYPIFLIIDGMNSMIFKIEIILSNVLNRFWLFLSILLLWIYVILFKTCRFYHVFLDFKRLCFITTVF